MTTPLDDAATAGGPASGSRVPPAAPGRVRRLWRSHARTAAAAALGATAAAAYAHFVGCRTGTCPITANVWTASLYGSLVGAVAGWPSRVR